MCKKAFNRRDAGAHSFGSEEISAGTRTKSCRVERSHGADVRGPGSGGPLSAYPPVTFADAAGIERPQRTADQSRIAGLGDWQLAALSTNGDMLLLLCYGSRRACFLRLGQRHADDVGGSGAVSGVRANLDQTSYCPACLLEDSQADSPSQGARLGRVAWMIEPMRTCRRHGIALVRRKNKVSAEKFQLMAGLPPKKRFSLK